MAAAGVGDEEVKLLGMWASPFVLRVQLALLLKGIPYEYVEEDLKSKSELLLRSNPVHHKVPVLIHAGRPVCESSVILQYLDEAFPAAAPLLLPADPHARAAARFWGAYVDDVLIKASTGKTAEEKAEGKEKAAAAVAALEGALRECSGGGGGGERPFFGGEGPGYVDVVLGALLGWVRAGDAMQDGARTFDPAATPLLAAWADRFLALDGVEAAMPDVGRLVELAVARHARSAASS